MSKQFKPPTCRTCKCRKWCLERSRGYVCRDYKKGDKAMRYRIEYASGRCQSFANGRQDLLEWLKLLKDEVITDIRLVCKSGVSDSVIEKYRRYIKNEPAGCNRTGSGS